MHCRRAKFVQQLVVRLEKPRVLVRSLMECLGLLVVVLLLDAHSLEELLCNLLNTV